MGLLADFEGHWPLGAINLSPGGEILRLGSSFLGFSNGFTGVTGLHLFGADLGKLVSL